jgi:hypothetical protein
VSTFGARKRGMRKRESGIIALDRFAWERRNRAKRTSPLTRGKATRRFRQPSCGAKESA